VVTAFVRPDRGECNKRADLGECFEGAWSDYWSDSKEGRRILGRNTLRLYRAVTVPWRMIITSLPQVNLPRELALASSPDIGRCTFPLGWTPKLAELE